MKKLLLTLVIIALSFVSAYAQDEEESIISFPFDTEVTTLWFPDDGTFGAGLSVTGVRLQIPQLDKVCLDLDGVVVKEVSGDEATLAGLGLSIGLLDVVEELGGNANLAFLPNIGLSMLIDYRNIDTKDFESYRWAVYGTVLSIKW